MKLSNYEHNALGLIWKLTFHLGKAILRTKLTQEAMSKKNLQA